jgi:hypothetical protein
MILWDYRLIDESLRDHLYDRLEAGDDPEPLLRGYVQVAYFTFHVADNYLN